MSRCTSGSATITWFASSDNNDPVSEYVVEYGSGAAGSADGGDRPVVYFNTTRYRVDNDENYSSLADDARTIGSAHDAAVWSASPAVPVPAATTAPTEYGNGISLYVIIT